MNILILTNNFECKLIYDLKKNDELIISVTSDYNSVSEEHELVIAHNYDKIIPLEIFDRPKIGIFILHSSDLPKGRGWAPIYNSIVNQDETYTISLIKISEKIDEGNIFIKLKIKKPKIITNDNLRNIDEEGSIGVLVHFIDLIKNGKLSNSSIGLPQNHEEATYNKRRNPFDNQLDVNKNIKDIVYEILATNENYPAFIEIDGEKIFLNAKIEKYYFLADLEYKMEVFL